MGLPRTSNTLHMTVGPQATISINAAGYDQTLYFSGTMTFSREATGRDITKTLINGLPLTLPIRRGRRGRFEMVRVDNSFESFYQWLESLQRQGFADPDITILLSVKEANNTTTKSLLTGVRVLSTSNFGSYSGEDTVTQSFEFTAEEELPQ